VLARKSFRGKAVVEIWTHKIDGLVESDFITGETIDVNGGLFMR